MIARRPRPSTPSPGTASRGRVAAVAALAALGGWALARLGVSLARDAASYRRDAERLRDVWAVVGDVRRRARVATAGARPGRPPVVLVHGLGVSGAYWVPLAARLARRHAVFVLDLRAEDGSPELDAAGDGVERLAELVVGWLDALGIERALLVGNSLGCQAVVETAVTRPDRVAGLVLLGPTVDPSAPALWRQWARLVASAPFEPPALDALVVGDYLRAGPRTVTREVRAMLRHDLAAALPRVAAPTLVMRGVHDWIAPRRWVAEAARLAGGEWVEIPRGGHAVHFDEPDAVARAIERFARRRTGLAAPAVRAG